MEASAGGGAVLGSAEASGVVVAVADSVEASAAAVAVAGLAAAGADEAVAAVASEGQEMAAAAWEKAVGGAEVAAAGEGAVGVEAFVAWGPTAGEHGKQAGEVEKWVLSRYWQLPAESTLAAQHAPCRQLQRAPTPSTTPAAHPWLQLGTHHCEAGSGAALGR